MYTNMFRLSTLGSSLVLKKLAPPLPFMVPVAAKNTAVSNKHRDPKWKSFRRLKVIKVKYPDFYDPEQDDDDMDPDTIRSKLREKGLNPPRFWKQEREFYMSCTGGAFEPYVPPEGDGKMSVISKEGAKQVVDRISKKSTTWRTIRKIKTYDEEFEHKQFAQQAQDIYVAMHTQMAAVPVDKDNLIELVTEKAYPEVLHNLDRKVIKWNFIESIEPPRVVHGRQTYLVSKDNIFAQLTVRFHTKQVLAVYDRFGRICHGSPVTAKDVLEYVVFEKHLSDTYGTWRIHHKIIPSWMDIPPQDRRTLRLEPEPESQEPETPQVESASESSQVSSLPPPPADSHQPQLASA